MRLSPYSCFFVFDLFGIFEELLPQRQEILRSGDGRSRFSSAPSQIAPANPALKSRTSAIELPVQMPLLAHVFSHGAQNGNPVGHLKAAQKSLKTIKTIILG